MTTPDITAQLAEIQAMESAAFRVGQVGRRLFQEHPVLASGRVAASTYGDSASLSLDDQSLHCVEIEAWAAVLGIELSHTLKPVSIQRSPEWAGRAELRGQVVIDGVTVALRGMRLLTQEQWDAAQPDGEVAA